MSAVKRLSAVLLALLLAGGALAYLLLGIPPPQLSFDARSIDPTAGGFELTAGKRLDPNVFAMIAPADYLFRLYREAESDWGIWTYVAFYQGDGGLDAHDPDVCYPAQGWEIADRREVRLPMPDGAELHATLLRAHLGGIEEQALYWFQPAGRWPGGALTEDLLRVYDRLRGAPEYAFVRLSTPGGAGGDTFQRLRRFGQLLAPLVRAELEAGALRGRLGSGS